MTGPPAPRPSSLSNWFSAIAPRPTPQRPKKWRRVISWRRCWGVIRGDEVVGVKKRARHRDERGGFGGSGSFREGGGEEFVCGLNVGGKIGELHGVIAAENREFLFTRLAAEAEREGAADARFGVAVGNFAQHARGEALREFDEGGIVRTVSAWSGVSERGRRVQTVWKSGASNVPKSGYGALR